MSYITTQELRDASIDAGTLERFTTGVVGQPNINRNGDDVGNLQTLKSQVFEVAQQAANMQTYLTKAEMEAAGPQPKGTVAQVTNDPDPANNGYWVFDGSQWVWSGVQPPNAEDVSKLTEKVATVDVKTENMLRAKVEDYALAWYGRNPNPKLVLGVKKDDGTVEVPRAEIDRLRSPSIPHSVPPLGDWEAMDIAPAAAGYKLVRGMKRNGDVYQTLKQHGLTLISSPSWGKRIAELEAFSKRQSGPGSMGDLVSALRNPLRDVNLTVIGASIEWGLTLPENSDPNGAEGDRPRTGHLSDVRDNLDSPSYINLYRHWLGHAYLTLAPDEKPTVEDAPGVGQVGDGGSGYFTDPHQALQFYKSQHIRLFSSQGVQIPHVGVAPSGASVRTALSLPAGAYVEFEHQGSGFTLWFGKTPTGGLIEIAVGDDVVMSESYTGATSFQNQVEVVLSNASHKIRIRNAGVASLPLEQITRTKTIRVVNQGIIGRSSGNWSPNSSTGLLAGALPENPTHVLIAGLGPNDRAGNFDPQTVWRVKDNVGLIVDWLNSRGVKAIIRGSTYRSPDLPENAANFFSTQQIAQALRELALERGVSYIDSHVRSIEKRMNNSWSTSAGDQSHPNAIGHYWNFQDLINAHIRYEDI